ncbi:bacteriocin-type signal sequence [Treponema denticola]|uniref:bacteriocin-type signal sequence n=1 Tax=Treponema denticola TaxID=158 RepID=UPI0021F908A2|nr:bacteriocin-type signal sequence [Treponema denticola]UYT07571.1 bacteriocin-type signal sequence [Treponema denticola]
MKKIIKLTDEELLLVRGGTDKEKYNSVGEIVRRTNLKYAQDVVREAAIYRPYAKGNFDYEGAAEDVTWCNQSSYDVMEATGVHMKPFYGKPDGYEGKEGQRGAGYWVNANTACKNVENYIDKYAKEWVNAKIKEVGLTNIEAGFDYIGPNSVKNYNEAYTKKYNELSALQPITSLNVAGLPVNDTAIKEDPFGA